MALALLVDRDPDTRLMYAEYLRMLAFHTDEAEDGREALAKALSLQPSVIVTDTRLPGMSGLELCRVLRNDALTRSIPIIVVTGDGFEANLKLAKAAGADAVLVKPCLPEDLCVEVQRLLSKSQELRAHARTLHEQVGAQVAISHTLVERTETNTRKMALSRVHQRGTTSNPPTAPPSLRCPTCDQPMRYIASQIGGVSERHTEQWDHFECASCHGAFEYRHRTRKLRLSDPLRS
jgi:CheY-like chemotaxis protein